MSSGAHISAGTEVAFYRIEGPLGEGGMGTVYRAIDTKLNRPVAVKFLSNSVADAAARRRFQREAQMASSLNHPHILTVHDIGEHEGRQYLVTEFVDGGTLKDWAKAEKRSWRQIVELLTGVADGLAEAHGAAILHRDIKPANILVAKNGYAKLADFGLAKMCGEPAPVEETLTLTNMQTQAGSIVGTIAYMSPEQASGKPLDTRSDIFSFGVVLYELLAGCRPFTGVSELEVLTKVIHHTQESLAEDIPIALRMSIEKALEKDPAERYQSMRDMVVDLRRVMQRKMPEAPVDVSAKARTSWLPWAVTSGVTAIALGVGLYFYFGSGAELQDPLAGAKFTRLTNFSGDETGAAISSDGKFAVFMSDRAGPNDLWRVQIGSNNFENLTTGTFHPNSRFQRPSGFTPDGAEVWISGPPPPTSRMALLALTGGAQRAFLSDKTVNVAWSPDGRRIVYNNNIDGDPMFIADADSTHARELFKGGPGEHNHFPVWSTDGQWIYFLRGQVSSVQFDLWRIASAGGQPEQLTHHNGYLAYPTPLDTRRVLYVAEDQDGGPWLWLLDVDKKTTRRLNGLDRYSSIAATADGRQLIAAVTNPNVTLWTLPISGGEPVKESNLKPFTVPNTRALAPVFGTDALFFLSSLDGRDGLWRQQNGQATEVWKGSQGAVVQVPAISPDGKQAALVLARGGRHTLQVLKSDGSEVGAAFEGLEVRGAPTWSPDGQWIVIGGKDDGGDGLFKLPAAGGMPTRLTTGFALDPVWSKGRDLIVYCGVHVAGHHPLLAIHKDGSPADFPEVIVYGDGTPVRFLEDGSGMVYLTRTEVTDDFWLLDLKTGGKRRLTQLNGEPAKIRSFDITRDGREIVFDRQQGNADIVLIAPR